MKLTKYGHSCLFIEKEGELLVIDPGCFTTLPESIPNTITTIVVTEEHADHFDKANIQKLLTNNPGATIYTTSTVGGELLQSGIKSQSVTGNQEVSAGNFTLHFTETDHAPIYKTAPCKSLAVQVDDKFYYPSDSFQTTQNPVVLLALPTSGPWYKVSEAIDFVKQTDCKQVLVTHNSLNSQTGDTVVVNHIQKNTGEDLKISILQPGQSIEL